MDSTYSLVFLFLGHGQVSDDKRLCVTVSTTPRSTQGATHAPGTSTGAWMMELSFCKGLHYRSLTVRPTVIDTSWPGKSGGVENRSEMVPWMDGAWMGFQRPHNLVGTPCGEQFISCDTAYGGVGPFAFDNGVRRGATN